MRLWKILCFSIVLATTSLAWADSHPHQREGFTFGLSLGGGSGRWNFPAVSTEDVGGGVIGLRAGMALNSHWVLTGNLDTWARRDDVLGVDVTLNIVTLTAVATFFPGSPESGAGGFFLRAGFGIGSTSAEFAFSGVAEKFEEGGAAGQFGLGYEFRVTPRFAFGVSANGTAVGLNSDAIDSAQFGSFVLQGNWYFD